MKIFLTKSFFSNLPLFFAFVVGDVCCSDFGSAFPGKKFRLIALGTGLDSFSDHGTDDSAWSSMRSDAEIRLRLELSKKKYVHEGKNLNDFE